MVPARERCCAGWRSCSTSSEEYRATGDLARAAAADRCFHAEIVRAAGNAILAQLYDQLRDRQLRMGVQVMHAEPHRVARNIEEHTEILAALRDGDGEAAAAAVRRHVGRVKAIAHGEQA